MRTNVRTPGACVLNEQLFTLFTPFFECEQNVNNDKKGKILGNFFFEDKIAASFAFYMIINIFLKL